MSGNSARIIGGGVRWAAVSPSFECAATLMNVAAKPKLREHLPSRVGNLYTDLSALPYRAPGCAS